MTEQPMAAAALAAPAAPRVPDPRYSVHVGDLRTGELYGTVPVSGCSWSREIGGGANFNLSIPDTPEADGLWPMLASGKALAAVEWSANFGHRIVGASPVVARGVSSGGVSLGGSGIFGHLGRRLLIADTTDDNLSTAFALNLGGMDFGSMMAEMVTRVLTMPEGDLPIVVEPLRAGSRQQSYASADLAMVAQRMTELSQRINGPDFDFRPRFKDDKRTSLVWDLVTGTETQPALDSARTLPYVLDGLAPNQQTVRDVEIPESASDLATHVYGKGGGTEGGIVIRSAVDTALTAQGWPRYDAVKDNDALDAANVQAWADGDLAARKRPARGIRVTVDAAWWWAQGALLGDSVRVISRLPLIGRIDVTSRVIGEAGDVASDTVTLTLADTLAEDVI